MKRYSTSQAYHLATGFAIIAETCDPELISAAIEKLSELRTRLSKGSQDVSN